MPDMWLDDHVGDEVHARPEFRSTLRESLADELGRRRPPWRALAWSAAAAVAVLVVTTAVITTHDGGPRIGPKGSTLSGDRLAAAIVHHEWYLVSIDGEFSANAAYVVLDPDGSFAGADGCNSFSSTDNEPDDGWHLDERRLRIVGGIRTTLMACYPNGGEVPLQDGSGLSLSDDGTTLTMTGSRTFVLSTDPTTSHVQDRRWYLARDDGSAITNGPWFELRSDGSFSGHDGCNSYFSYTRDDPPQRAWFFEGMQLRIAGGTGSTRMACAGDSVMPLSDGALFRFRGAVDFLFVVAGEQSWTFVAADSRQLAPASTSTTGEEQPG